MIYMLVVQYFSICIVLMWSAHNALIQLWIQGPLETVYKQVDSYLLIYSVHVESSGNG